MDEEKGVTRRQALLATAGALSAFAAKRSRLSLEGYIWQNYAAREKKPLADLLDELFATAPYAGYQNIELNNGFFGPASWYMNHARNITFAERARDGGRLTLPVLFLHGEYDYTCQTVPSRLAEPMRQDCADLTEVVGRSGHWMAQEKPAAVNAALARWLATRVPAAWPEPG